MTELKYTGRTFKPVKYFFSLSCQEVHLNVLLRKKTPTYSKRSFQCKGALDCRFSYTNPIVYLNVAHLPMHFSGTFSCSHPGDISVPLDCLSAVVCKVVL